MNHESVLPEVLLTQILWFLPPRDVMSLSECVCWRWALAGEEVLRNHCEHHQWRPPRSRRLQGRSVEASVLKWRALFLSRCCPACLNVPGDFAVRRSSMEAPQCFLCSRCCKTERVVKKLQDMRATLDVTGLSGKALYTSRKGVPGSKFCSEVHMAAKQAGFG